MSASTAIRTKSVWEKKKIEEKKAENSKNVKHFASELAVPAAETLQKKTGWEIKIASFFIR